MFYRMRFSLILCCLTLLYAAFTKADDDLLQVQIAEPFIELHSGPGRGYPVFHVAPKGDWVNVLKRKTSWFKVQTADGMQGWVKQDALQQTLATNGEPLSINTGSFEDYQQRDFELGVAGGLLESVTALTVSAGWVLTENIATEMSFTQALGDFSENRYGLLSVRHTPFPEWRISPFISFGVGQLQTKPKANLVQSGDATRTSDVLSVGAGSRFYLARNFVVNLEYKQVLVLTDRDTHEELEQWQLGFNVYF